MRVQTGQKGPTTSKFSMASRLTAWLSGALALAMAALVGAALLDARQDTWTHASQDARNLVRAMEADLATDIQVSDGALRAAAEILQQSAAKGELLPTSTALQQIIGIAGRLDALLLVDAAGQVISTSRPGLPATNLADRDYFDIHRRQTDAGLYVSRPYRSRRADGAWSIGISRRLEKADGSFAGVALGVLRLTELQRQFSRLELNPRDSVALIRTDGILLARYPFVEAAIGSDRSQFSGFRRMMDTPADQSVANSAMEGVQRLYTHRHIEGAPLLVGLAQDVAGIYAVWWRKVLVVGIVALLLVGAMVGLVAVLRRELAKRQQAEQEVRTRERRYRALAEAGYSVIWRADQAGAILEAHGWEELTGQPADSARGNGWIEMLCPADEGEAAAAWAAARAAVRPLDMEFRVRSRGRDGWHWVRSRAVPVFEDRHRLVEWVGVVEDIHERHQAEERIRYLALHDGLTGLPNRYLFRDELQKAVADETRFAVLWLDLDGFKRVNDARGHEAGDRLLTQVADRLRESLPETDLLARFGGDEFVILQRYAGGHNAAVALARHLIAALDQPFVLDGQQAVIGTSVGIALYPEDASCSEDLLRHADVALYKAKVDGRGTFRRFDPLMIANLHERNQLEIELREALRNEQISPHYQPICHARTREVVGFEALARWRHPVRGDIPPSVFITLAEECGLIIPLGRQVLEKACAEAATWPQPVRVAVNLSPAQFRLEDLAGEIADILARTGLPGERLELEVTESLMIDDPERVLGTMQAIKAMGVRIALDDFGTGYASLSYLRRFPFDKMKIDQSFIRNLGQDDENALSLVRSLLDLGQSLGLDVLAEGVETEAQLDVLRDLGSLHVQGYLLGKPMPPEAIRDCLVESARSAILAARAIPSRGISSDQAE
jgi:diguanylate cyclase (GGDEF)-like protein/PAS domain S-box-containing protein